MRFIAQDEYSDFTIPSTAESFRPTRLRDTVHSSIWFSSGRTEADGEDFVRLFLRRFRGRFYDGVQRRNIFQLRRSAPEGPDVGVNVLGLLVRQGALGKIRHRR